jgi:hypothetical protein
MMDILTEIESAIAAWNERTDTAAGVVYIPASREVELRNAFAEAYRFGNPCTGPLSSIRVLGCEVRTHDGEGVVAVGT